MSDYESDYAPGPGSDSSESDDADAVADDSGPELVVPVVLPPNCNPDNYPPTACVSRVYNQLVRRPAVRVLNSSVPEEEWIKLARRSGPDGYWISFPADHWCVFHDSSTGVDSHYTQATVDGLIGYLHTSAALCNLRNIKGFLSAEVWEQASHLIQSLQRAGGLDCNGANFCFENGEEKCGRLICAVGYTYILLWLRRKAAALPHPLPPGSSVPLPATVEELYGDQDLWSEAYSLYGGPTSVYIKLMRDIAYSYPGSLDLDTQGAEMARERCKAIHVSDGERPGCIFLQWKLHLKGVDENHPLWPKLTRNIGRHVDVQMDAEDPGRRHELAYGAVG